MLDLHVVLVLPPEPETEKEERDAQLEVVKPHIEEVVEGERETEPGIYREFPILVFVDSVKEVEESERNHAYRDGKKDLLGDDGWEHVEEG